MPFSKKKINAESGGSKVIAVNYSDSIEDKMSRLLTTSFTPHTQIHKHTHTHKCIQRD